jgi:hypothetical protein
MIGQLYVGVFAARYPHVCSKAFCKLDLSCRLLFRYAAR